MARFIPEISESLEARFPNARFTEHELAEIDRAELMLRLQLHALETAPDQAVAALYKGKVRAALKDLHDAPRGALAYVFGMFGPNGYGPGIEDACKPVRFADVVVTDLGDGRHRVAA